LGSGPRRDGGAGRVGRDGVTRLTASLIGRLGYIGIVLLLVLGGLGLPVPEEAPILLAAVLSRKRQMVWPIALASCFVGVLVGDFLVYFLGFVYGEKVLGFRLTRKLLTKAREAQIKGYFHRHGIKILILGRFAVGFRTAAYLTAGILRLPALRLFLADLFAATLSTVLMFAAGYFFADWIEAGLKEMKHYLVVVVGAAFGAWLLYRYVKARRRAGRVVGPPVPITDDVPLPPDDLHSGQFPTLPAANEPSRVLTVFAVPDAAPPLVVEVDTASSAPVEPTPALAPKPAP
jgi:membrane protein DedA with SNARE-associated domain